MGTPSRMINSMLPGVVLLWIATANAGTPAEAYTPGEVVEKAVNYHDPNGVWGTGRIQLGIQTTYSDDLAERFGSKDVRLVLVLSPGHETFSYTKDAGDDNIEIRVERGQGSVIVNGSAQVSEEEKNRLRLRDALLYRDYCEYLYGMPMKLRDPGAIFDPRVNSVRFSDRAAWRLKVTYDPDVGTDTWYFYFDRDTFALIGYQFYKDESKNDGEYILFEGEIVDEASGLRLPKARAWYYNADDGYLATDDIVSLSVSGD